MNVLFLSLSTIASFDDRGIYPDLIREMIKNGHNVFCVSSVERREKKKTHLVDYGNSKSLVVRTPNIQKTNLLEKGIGILTVKTLFKRAIKKYFKGVRFDLIIYPTPPITLCGVVNCFKKRDQAKTYLMLKDIFPQNAVDLGLIKRSGIGEILYRFFRNQEKKLYAVSDKIGCMSPANVEYVLEHNREIEKEKVEVFPNCIEVQDIILTKEEKEQIRAKYELPLDKKIFVYGGNFGKPQGVPFIIDCLKEEKENDEVCFLMAGDGTEYPKLEKYLNESKQGNFKLLKRLSAKEFDKVLASCDVGLIFLDHRFTIPNFPSRLLSYMQAGLPILACTDTATDIGKTIVDGGFGWWCESDEPFSFSQTIEAALKCKLPQLGQLSKKFMLTHYDLERYCKSLLQKER